MRKLDKINLDILVAEAVPERGLGLAIMDRLKKAAAGHVEIGEYSSIWFNAVLRADADRILRLVAGRPNVCVGTGAVPYETPPENVLRLIDYVSRF